MWKLQDIEKSVLSINDLLLDIENGEISPIVAYKYLRSFEWTIKNALKLIENQTRDMVEESPLEYKEFRISIRKTYDIKSNAYYNSKYEELQIAEKLDEMKKIEKLVKVATDNWESIITEDWEIIEPVEVKNSQILSYTPKKK